MVEYILDKESVTIETSRQTQNDGKPLTIVDGEFAEIASVSWVTNAKVKRGVLDIGGLNLALKVNESNLSDEIKIVLRLKRKE